MKNNFNQSINKYINKWKSYDISENDGFLKICFGTLGHQMDFDTLINVLNNLSIKVLS